MKNLLFVISLYCMISTLLSQTSQESLEACKKYGWGFSNYTDNEDYTWDVYCHSFYGITSDPEVITNVFDDEFFDHVFKTISQGSGGSCFGMALLSLMMNKYGGYLGFCTPPISHGSNTISSGEPADTELRRAIGIMHGRQLGLACIQEYINQRNGGYSLNANYGLNIAKQILAREGPCLVSISNNASHSKGHTMIAYKITGDAPNFCIWVVDPSRPLSGNYTWYAGDNNTLPENYIKITSGNWSFIKQNGDVWPIYDDIAGAVTGHLLFFPISVVGPPSRTPSSLGFDVLFLATQIFIWGTRTDENIWLLNDDANSMLGNTIFPIVFNIKYFDRLRKPRMMNPCLNIFESKPINNR